MIRQKPRSPDQGVLVVVCTAGRPNRQTSPRNHSRRPPFLQPCPPHPTVLFSPCRTVSVISLYLHSLRLSFSSLLALALCPLFRPSPSSSFTVPQAPPQGSSFICISFLRDIFLHISHSRLYLHPFICKLSRSSWASQLASLFADRSSRHISFARRLLFYFLFPSHRLLFFPPLPFILSFIYPLFLIRDTCRRNTFRPCILNVL